MAGVRTRVQNTCEVLIADRSDDKAEGHRLSIEKILLERPCAPGVDTSKALLSQVKVHPCLAERTLRLMSKRLELERVSLVIVLIADIHFLSTERKRRCRELDIRSYLEACSIIIKHLNPLELSLCSGLLRTDISVVILILNPLSIVTDKC